MVLVLLDLLTRDFDERRWNAEHHIQFMCLLVRIQFCEFEFLVKAMAGNFLVSRLISIFYAISNFTYFCSRLKMVVIAQLVRASDCGSEGRRFEPG